MSDWGNETADALRRRIQQLSTSQQMVLLLVVALVAVSALWASHVVHPSGLKAFLNALGTGLFVSAAFGAAQALITGHITFDLLRQNVVSEVERMRRDFATEVTDIVGRSNPRFLPQHVFRDTREPDKDFNKQISADLKQSNQFWFRGVSARYTAVRLFACPNASLDAHLVLPDIADARSLDARAGYLIRQGLENGSQSDVLRRIRKSATVGLVGLYFARQQCASLEILLTPNPSLDRVELYDSAVWVTLFSSVASGTRFPETLRFGKDSLLRSMQYEECRQLKQSSTVRKFEFPRHMTDLDFLRQYREMTGEDLSVEELAELAAEFERFKVDNLDKMRGDG